MEFHVNHPILYILAGILVLVVLGGAWFTLRRISEKSKA